MLLCNFRRLEVATTCALIRGILEKVLLHANLGFGNSMHFQSLGQILGYVLLIFSLHKLVSGS